MNSLTNILNRVRGLNLDKVAGLRPPYPPVALEFDRDRMVLVRLKRRRGRLTLEAHQVREMPEQTLSGSVMRPSLGSPDKIAARVKELFDNSGTRPGRVSLLVPDNLAKVTLLALPERPASRKQLEQIIRFKMRRAVPFRLEEAVTSYEVLPGGGKGVNVLVVLLRRFIVEQYEQIFDQAGARVGLVDLCTPSLFNLCRSEIATACAAGVDAAVLNTTPAYFSLLIVRGGQLIFYRCKSYAVGDENGHSANGAMEREIATSLDYYREKLSGQGVNTAFVRTVAQPIEELEELLNRIGIERVETIEPAAALHMVEGMRLETSVGQRIAPAVGAAAGRA